MVSLSKLSAYFLSALSLIACLSAMAQTKHSDQTAYPSYKGLVMSGYQGWFRAEGDGSGATNYSYGNARRSGVDLWPDVSEYEKTYKTPFKLANGERARFFSSYDKSTVDLHFRWMQEYGVDGVFMQRFFNNARSQNRDNAGATVLQNAFEAASKYNRAIAVMYDLSGMHRGGEDCSAIIEDWKYLVDELKVTNQEGQKTYLHHNGKPVVAIWGVGFPDRPYNIRNIGLERLIDFLKNDPVYGGCTVMLGVPTAFRELNADCINDPYLHELIRMADIVLPWTVQRYSPLLHNDMDRLRDNTVADMAWCRENEVEYVPCVYPGFSWHNLSRYEFPDDIKPVGSIPRMQGKFYWQQIATVLRSGAPMLYAAMFDEVNEATAIFKVSDNPPVATGYGIEFVDNEGVPSDHYLWLTGEAGRVLRKEAPISMSLPSRDLGRILVFSKTAGFHHNSIEQGIQAIQQLGRVNGVQVDTTIDATKFNDENLQQYDAVVFLSTTGNVLDDTQQAAFERYIQAGGGFAGVHAAADCEYDWPWFGQLVGGYFAGHPAVQPAVLDVVDSDFIATRPLPRQWQRRDEWYKFRDHSESVHVLINLDEDSYHPGEHGMGNPHPMSWYHEFDGGRAFYTGLGHTEESFLEPLFLKHLWGGISYAMGLAD